ncbi:MAG: 50S ribosomal protein L36 [Candidatus Roizmanbacteria bacterium]
MKSHSAVKKRCPSCRIVVRRGRMQVTCKNSKCRQRQG